MTFLEPLLLLGVIGAAVPVLIHLLGRSRARVLRLPTVALLRLAQAQPSRRRRLRERLLLAARVAAAALVAIVLARPAIWAAAGPASGADRVAVVVDDSFSMSRGPLFDQARAKARAAVETVLEGGGVAALFLGGRGGRDPVPALSRDVAALNGALGALRVSARSTDLEGAVARARAALRGSGRVVVVTDGTAPVPSGPDIEVVDVGARATLANVAVTRVAAEPDLAEPAGTLRVSAEVTNFSDRTRTVALALRSKERIFSRANLSLSPGERRTQQLSVRPPRGRTLARLSLEADDLVVDDTRHLVLEGSAEIRALIVNGDPRDVRAMDEAFYVRAALDAPGEPTIRARAVLPEGVAKRLPEQDVVLLLNVRALLREDEDAVTSFVRRGGGLLASLGSQVDTEDAGAVPWLGGVRLVSVWSAGSRGPEEDPGRMMRLGDLALDHPALAPFAGQPDALRSARFWGRGLVRSGSAGGRTLARFADGAPALVERDVGRGRILLFASTLDRDWNDLVIRPAFAPLLRRIVTYLGRRSAGAKVADRLVGETCPAPEGVGRVARPDGKEERFSGSYGNTDVPGVYRLRGADGVEVFCAVNVDPKESELRRVSFSAAPVRTEAAAGRRADPVAHVFAAVLLALLLGESLLACRTDARGRSGGRIRTAPSDERAFGEALEGPRLP